MKIGIDIDGVMTDLERYLLDEGIKYNVLNEIDYKVNYGAYSSSGLFEWQREDHDDFWENNLFRYANIPPRAYVGEVIHKLKELGCEIYIITARDLSEREDELGTRMRNVVRKWLNKYKIEYDELIFSSSYKVDICKKKEISMMIEDSPKNITSISKLIPVICMNCEYNKEVSGENIIRAYSWYDIYSIIKGRL